MSSLESTTQYHEATHKNVLRIRERFNDIKGTMDKARSAIHWADHIMGEVEIMGRIAKDLEMEDLDPNMFVRNIELYIQDYLVKLEALVVSRVEEERV